MINKRFIFTVTTGRTGTLFLANMLPIFKGVTALHEPLPSFSSHIREIQSNPKIASDFLINEKVPAILHSSPSPIYAETSNFFCKGYLEPWLEIDDFPTPDLILLNRNFRKISLSNLALKVIPAKTQQGLKFMLAPFDESCLTTVENWKDLNDYQLCYWYCLEIEERKKRYAKLIEQRGGLYVSTSLVRLRTINGILELRRKLDLAPLNLHGWLSYFKRRREHLNQKLKSKAKLEITPESLSEWEEEVRQRTTAKQ